MYTMFIFLAELEYFNVFPHLNMDDIYMLMKMI